MKIIPDRALMKRKIFILFLSFVQVSFIFSQNSKDLSKEYTRFDIGYQQNDFMPHNAWNPKCATFEFEASLKNPAVSFNYRLDLGVTRDNNFYLHMPMGPVIGLIAAGFAGKIGCSSMPVEKLFLLVPDGITYYPLRSNVVHIGLYANFISFDFASGKTGGFDYAPDTGLKGLFFVSDRFFLFVRSSLKYSHKFAGWGAQASIGFGWEFEQKEN